MTKFSIDPSRRAHIERCRDTAFAAAAKAAEAANDASRYRRDSREALERAQAEQRRTGGRTPVPLELVKAAEQAERDFERANQARETTWKTRNEVGRLADRCRSHAEKESR